MHKIKLSSRPFCNDCHFFLLGVVGVLLSLKHPIFLVGVLGYLYFLKKKTKLFLPCLFILTCILFSYFLGKQRLNYEEDGICQGKFLVVDVTDRQIIIKKDTKYIVYKTDSDLIPGDVIEAELKVYTLSTASYAGDFDEKTYYAAKGITNRAVILQYRKIDETWSIAKIRWFCLAFFKDRLGEKSFSYMKTLIFGINGLDKEVKKAYSSLYISHILAISGLHINFLFFSLVHFFQKLFKIDGEKLTICLLGIYVVLIGFPIACLRAFMFLCLEHGNKKKEFQYTRLDILSITYIGMVFLFPLQAFQTGFILSFLISFILIFMKDFYNGKSKFKKNIFTSFVCILTILPFIINQTYSLSIMGILFSFGLSFLLSKFLLPLVFSMLFLPNPLYEPLFQGIDFILKQLSDNIYSIRVPYMSFGWMSLYYLILIYILVCFAKGVKKHTIFYLILYFLLLITLRKTNIFYKVTFIDVGQGDSALIEFPFQKGNILIDAYNNVEYLKNKGINKIDCVVLTHFDKDHMESIFELVDCFDVKKIIYSAYEDIEKIKDIKVEKQGVHGKESFQISEVKFNVLGPVKPYADRNANSVVLSFALNGYTFLFTGDMTIEAEYDLVEKYHNQLNCDVLKVGHHGSSTSSSEYFLKYCSPSYAIISVSKYNIYNLPNIEVEERLKKSAVVLETKDCGNIEIIPKKKLEVISYRKKT